MAMPTAKFEKLESSLDVASPCIGICTLDENKLCRGCGRTDDEIASWMFLSYNEKQQVIDQLSTRQGEHQEHGDFPSF